MLTFEQAVLNVYLPAYKDLYALNKNLDKRTLAEKLYLITRTLKAHNDCAVGVAIEGKCNAILNSVSNDLSKITRKDLDLKLFSLLYSLRLQLKTFCIEYYPLSGSSTLKLEKHYTWNIR